VTRYLTVEQSLRIARFAVGGPTGLARDVRVLCQERRRADPDDDAGYDLVLAVASGALDEIEGTAATLTSFASTVE